jgi:tetratricopeptide (TPR) repeat protein
MESRKQLQPAAICYLAAAQASAQAETIKSELRKTVDLLVQLSGAATNGGFENTLDSVVLATSPATSNQLASLADLAVAQISAKHYAAGEVSCRLAIALMVASPPLKTSPSEQTHRLLSALQDCYINQGRFRDMYATFGAIAESTSAMSDKEPLDFCYWSQATAKYELKDYGAAAPFYSKAISTLQHSGRGGSEEFAAMRYDQGQNFFKLNQLEDAERSFEDALAICTNLGLKEKQDSIRALLAQLRGEPEAPAPPTAHSEHEHMARPERAQHAAARSRFAKSHAGPEKHGLRGIFSKAKHLLGF